MVVEAAVLVEAKWFDIPDTIWTLEVPEDCNYVQRIMDRNGISKEDAVARIRSQRFLHKNEDSMLRWKSIRIDLKKRRENLY
jgi:dephospho-CoA kinase